jgi:hypothetical protein
VDLEGRGVFEPTQFRDALADVGLDVLTFQIETCGVIERNEQQHWFLAGENRFALENARNDPSGQMLCASGWLNDSASPYRLIATAIRPAGSRSPPAP